MTVSPPADGVLAPEDDDTPLVPARMLNEVVYYPRLFWLEHVAGEWADNADTVSGRRVHKRVDKGPTPMPPADALPPEFKARSITVTEPVLGIIAKTDLVEAEDGAVVPVDYKRGEAPDPDRVMTGIWPADRVQIGAQAMALRAAGYRCETATVYYAASKTRVDTPVDEGLVREVEAALREARRVRALPIAPAPLVDSPKCPRCSLVGLCLPDEITLLRARMEDPDAGAGSTVDARTQAHVLREPDAPDPTAPPAPSAEDDVNDAWGIGPERPAPRQLVASKREGRAVYVQSYGGKVSKKGETLEVWTKDAGVSTVTLGDLESMALFGNISISPAVLSELCSRGIPLALFSHGGWFQGLVLSPSDHNVGTRVAQYGAFVDRARRLSIARAIVRGKILNQRVIVRRNARKPDEGVLGRLKDAARQALIAEDEESLLGIEGSAAREYFAAWRGMLQPRSGAEAAFDFTTRNRRPPTDPVNAMLSLGYAVLTRECTVAARLAGLDPAVGMYHHIRPGKPALALDLMEEFRPLIVDSVVLSLVNTDAVTPDDFVHAAGAVSLTDSGRKAFLQAFERRMTDEIQHPLFGYKVNYRRAIEVQARLLGRVLTGELDEYVPFRTR